MQRDQLSAHLQALSLANLHEALDAIGCKEESFQECEPGLCRYFDHGSLKLQS